MTGTSISTCTEPDEVTQALRCGGRFGLHVPEGIRLRTYIVRIGLPRISIFRIEETTSRIAFFSPPAGWVSIITPLDSSPSQVWGGHSLGAGELVTLSRPGAHSRVSGPDRTVVLCLWRRDLLRHGRALIGPEFELLPGLHRWHPPPRTLRSFKDLLNAAVQVARARPGAPSDALAAQGLERELLEHCVGCLAGGPISNGPCPGGPHNAAIMLRLEAQLQDRGRSSDPIASTCAALGISIHTLDACCAAHVGMNARRYSELCRSSRRYGASSPENTA